MYDLSVLCERYDLIFLQEHWLRPDELHLLNTIHPDFIGNGVSAMNISNGILLGRPFGGVCVIWRRSLSSHITVMKYDDSRIIGCKFSSDGIDKVYLNVYLPYQCDDNHDEYLCYLGKLTSIIDEMSTSHICIVGDFNAKKGSLFETELSCFVENCYMQISDYTYLDNISVLYTYVSDAHATTSWLDHYICSTAMHGVISEMNILDKLPSSDHMPITAVFSCHAVTEARPVTHHDGQAKTCKWYKAVPHDIARYTQATQRLLDGIHIPHAALSCTDVSCSHSEHVSDLDRLYQDMCTALHTDSLECIPISGCSKASQFIIPGWNDYVRDLHTEARHAYVTWRDYGKPRHGPVCELMRSTRLSFKYALRQCQSLENTHRADSLAKTLTDKDMLSFWKNIKQMNNKNVPLAPTVGGCTGATNISEMWRDHYSTILNSVNNVSQKDDVLKKFQQVSAADRLTITPSFIATAIASLKHGKSVGHDHLAAEHYIHAHSILHVILALLFTSFLSHGHLPDDLMKTIIVPLVKNKTGDLCDKNNYRPIALVTAISKILELVFLELIEGNISTTCNQFGFKKKHSTDMCIYTLKNVVNYYKQRSSPVFSCFLDASKAFDRVNYWCLFSKLITRNVPMLIVRLICFWYCNQLFCVKWDDFTSDFFKTSNGVRQGGILSPRFFTMYVDDLSCILSRMNAGCFIDDFCMNHFFYADDMCVLAPSATGLQLLLDACAQYGISHDIMYNPLKSHCMVFLPQRFRLNLPQVSLNDTLLEYVQYVKYLGVILCSDLKDDRDIGRQLRCLYAGANTLLRKFACCSKKVKLLLIESYCCTFYCGSLWTVYSNTALHKLNVAYNNVFRKVLGYRSRDSASTMFVLNHVDTFNARIRKSCYSFRQRVLQADNTMISHINDNMSVKSSYMWQRWQNILTIGAT